jgi:hypothetical protein
MATERKAKAAAQPRMNVSQMVGFLRSCVNSGESLSDADNAMIDRWLDEYTAPVAVPAPEAPTMPDVKVEAERIAQYLRAKGRILCQEDYVMFQAGWLAYKINEVETAPEVPTLGRCNRSAFPHLAKPQEKK